MGATRSNPLFFRVSGDKTGIHFCRTRCNGPKHPGNRQLYEKRDRPDAGAPLCGNHTNPKVATFRAALWPTFTLPLTVAAAIPEAAQGKPLEIWFQGEPDQKTVRGTVFPANARVGQQGTITRVWARRGTRPRAKRDTRTQWSFAGSLGTVAFTGSPVWCRLPGARCDRRPRPAPVPILGANTEAMTLHLTEIAAKFTPGAHALLILDGAGWHASDERACPDTITLPPDAPGRELLARPAIQRPRQHCLRHLRQQRHSLRQSLEHPQRHPKTVTSITPRSWATVNQ